MTKILDMACGSRMFWFDKENPHVDFIDKRKHFEKLPTGHIINVNPDIVADFRELPFEDESYHLVVFDPPHLLRAGEKSWLAKKYGKLNQKTWKDDISKGFDEAFRVLKPNGTLIFKWNEEQIKLSEIVKLIPYSPLFGNKRAKTHWLVFMKICD
ncbi:class I SAM-dependent methyltransferase [Lactococcus allomyrinae]|uniref:Class I SAM-dependent methyltransferase n=1 Tax=Lactococcus allomyrinae TaxID=2419773 RepID=A0A387BLV7_9LACT|nr:class I SAM-dependent methyltransferase [Lactococcus allomyrinae]AYG02006.1 class I SAM-dependent methyltransferase [Lactococcus allomyrinae]